MLFRSSAATGYISGSGTVTVTPPTMTFSGSPLTVSPGATGNLTLNLTGGAAPAGGLTVSLNSSATGVATVPATVNFTAGATSATVTVTGVAVGGPVTITASATGIASATASVTVGSLGSIIVGNVSVGMGGLRTLPVSLLANAPTGGVTINLASSDTSKVTVSPASVFIAAGATTSATQVLVTGVSLSTPSATITGSAAGYTSGSGTVTVTAQLSFGTAPTIDIACGPPQPGSLTLTLSGAAPAGGLTVSLSSSATGVATVPATVIIPAGATSVTVPVSGLSIGSTTITANVPTNPNILSATAPVTVINSGSCKGFQLPTGISVGQNLQGSISIGITPAAPVAGLQIKVTSSDINELLIAGRATDIGSQQVTFTASGSATSVGGIYLQGVANSGTATITVSAVGYPSAQATITLTPSGFLLIGPGGFGVSNFNTSVGVKTPLTVQAARLNADLTFAETQAVSAAAPTSVTLTSTPGNVGTITSPVNFTGGIGNLITNFTAGPNTGTATLTAVPPAGFSTPAAGLDTLSAVVSQSGIVAQSVTVGNNLEVPVQATLNGVAPPAGLTLLVTSNNSSLVKLSTTPNGAGSGSIPVIVQGGGSVSSTFYVQGFGSSGSATYTVAGSGFLSGTGTVTLTPSGFVLASPAGIGSDFTPLGMNPVTLSVFPAQLNADLTFNQVQLLAGGLSASVNVTSADTLVGTITTSPVTVAGDGTSVGTTNFQPVGNDPNSTTTLLSVSTPGTPAGFSTPANDASLTAKVLRSSFSLYCDGDPVGVNLQDSCTVQVSTTAGLAVTLTSNNTSVLQLASTATGASAGSIPVTIPAGSNSATFYVRSLASSGSATFTASASGYTSRNATIYPMPSGVVITNAGSAPFFSVPLASGPFTVNISTAWLNTDGSFGGTQALAPGSPAPVTVFLSSTDTSKGTIVSPVTIPNDGTGATTATFTPLTTGQTQIKVTTPAGFTACTTTNYVSPTAFVQ